MMQPVHIKVTTTIIVQEKEMVVLEQPLLQGQHMMKIITINQWVVLHGELIRAQ